MGDANTREIIKYILVGRRPWGLALTPDNKQLYVLNGLSDDMTVMIGLLMLLGCTASFGSTLDITVVTSQSEDRSRSEKSFAGITVKRNRPVLRAVELALFESSTLFETLGVQAQIHQLELVPDKEIEQQLESIPASGFVTLDVPFEQRLRAVLSIQHQKPATGCW